jgi:hypothetical protein
MLLPLPLVAAPMLLPLAAPMLVPMLACPMAMSPVVLMLEGGTDGSTAAAATGVAASMPSPGKPCFGIAGEPEGLLLDTRGAPAAAAAGIASIPGIVPIRSTWGFKLAALGATVVLPGSGTAMSGITADGGGGDGCHARWRRPWLPGIALVSDLGLGTVVVLALALLLTACTTWLEASGE